MNEITAEKLARSLTADNVYLIPHLPYLLQDLWELGTPHKDILGLFGNHIAEPSAMKVLDLACGKGAVGLYLAKECGCVVKMVDIMPEFIDYARQKAAEMNIEKLCSFDVEDIQVSVQRERDWDCVMLLAVGNVLGNVNETVSKLASTIRSGGYIILADSYIKENDRDKVLCEYDYPTYNEWLTAFEESNLKVIREVNESFEDLVSINDFSNLSIAKRAQELTLKYPEKSDLFLEYVQSQLNECQDIESTVVSPIWLLQKTN